MDGSPLALLKFLAPQIPSLANTALWHTVGMTEHSKYWDLRTAVTVQVLRQMMSGGGKPRSVESVQATTLKDPGIKGKMWVAKAVCKAPEEGQEGVREGVLRAIEEMKPEGAAQLNYTRPGLEDVEVEWTGYRPNAGKEESLPDIDEREKYKRLMAEPARTSETTLLYFHGGAYYLCDPSTHRLPCSRLAKETGGRVCSVRYRLAPQTAFPGQLLDALLVYLSLLYPPPDSLHEAIPASAIVLAGDSAGGNLSFALLQLLLQLHRTSSDPKILFHGKEVAVPLPAAVTANSGWFDISRCMPSLDHYAKFDYLPPVDHSSADPFKADVAWPADPPRGDLFCDLSLLDHPLVSPLVAKDWTGSPPLWLCTGWEMLHDEDAFVAARASGQGVTVVYEEFEAMPHCFQMLLPGAVNAGTCFESWGRFCKAVVEEGKGSVRTGGRLIRSKDGAEETLEVGKVSTFSLEEVVGRMREAKGKRVKGFQERARAREKAAL